MKQAKMMPPTFDSDHTKNLFTIRLLLHHMLGEEDMRWLTAFIEYELTIVTPLRLAGRLDYTIPEMINHPEQKYKTTE